MRRLWPRLLPRLLAATERLSVRWATGFGTETSLAREALQGGADRIVAVGGDGTLHHVINGFFEGDTRIAPAASCGFVPCGTGSDARHSLGLPSGIAAVDILRQGRRWPVDLLRLRRACTPDSLAPRYALNIASFGLSARVVAQMYRGLRCPAPPRLRYFSAIFSALATGRPAAVRLQLDGTLLPERRAWLVAIANGTTFGGGLRVAPTARMDDGRAHVVVVQACPAVSLLARAPCFYRGTHLALNCVSSYSGRSLVARAAQSGPVRGETDGEPVGRLPFAIDVVPGGLQMWSQSPPACGLGARSPGTA